MVLPLFAVTSPVTIPFFMRLQSSAKRNILLCSFTVLGSSESLVIPTSQTKPFIACLHVTCADV